VNATAGNVLITGVGNNGGGYAITTNNTIDATGNIDITTTSAAKHGVTLGGAVTSSAGGVTIYSDVRTSGSGSAINGNFAIKAKNDVTITGKTNSYFSVNGLGTIESTDGKVTIDATSTASRALNLTSTVTAKGNVFLKGTGGNNIGVVIDANVTSTSGNVEIEGTSVGDRGVDVNSGRVVKATQGDVKITGISTNARGIDVGNQTAYAPVAQIIAGKNIILDGTGKAGGVRTWGDSVLKAGTSVAGDINITGKSSESDGVNLWRFPRAAQFEASQDIIINGTANGVSGAGFNTTTSDVIGQAPMMKAGRNFTLTATNSNTGNTGNVINGQSGLQVTAGGDIKLNAIKANTTGNAIYFYSQTNGVGGNASFKSTAGDVLIQANKGGILFQNAMIPTAAVTYTTSTEISGRNVTIDNTGGTVTVDTTTGKATLAQGGGESTTNGLNLASTAGIKINATENINLSGKSTGAAGVLLGGPITVKALGDVNIKGTTTSAGAVQGVYLSGPSSVEGKNVDIVGKAFNGNGVLSYAAITATTGGSANITGTSTGTGGSASALSLWGDVTADQNVTLNGTNTNTANTAAAVFIGTDKKINAANGKIDVTASTSGATLNALQIYDGAKLTAKTEINLKADTLSISTAATPATIDAGTGKVTITTDSADAKINIGAADVGSTTSGSRTLGLTKAELDRITSGKTVIGDVAIHTGGIIVSADTSTAAVTGDITLQTKGNIEVNKKLSAAINKNLTLQAIGDITVGAAISQAGAGNIVIAAGLGKVAGDGTGVGQVKRSGSGTVSNTSNTSGNTYIYTGEVATSAKMAELNSAFTTLSLGTNAQSNTATVLSNPLASSANTQVLYREKIAVDLTDKSGSGGANNTLANATKIYGDVATNNDAVNAIKGANNPNKTLEWTTLNGNKFNLSSDALIGTLSVDNLASNLSTAQKLKASGTPYATSSLTYSVANGALPTLKINKLVISASNLSTVLSYTGGALTQNTPSLNNVVLSGSNKDVVSIKPLSLAKGTGVGVYTSQLSLDGGDAGNYEISADGQLIINYSGANKAPTPPETYTRIAGDVVNLAPVTFAVGVAPATAAGDEADPNICYAWGQRNGGSVTVHTVLKPSYLGLRHAKTDTQEAMSNSGGSSSHEASPCGKDFATNLAEANSL
jgi:hypothetical protein